jgi:hypothetical protein
MRRLLLIGLLVASVAPTAGSASLVNGPIYFVGSRDPDFYPQIYSLTAHGSGRLNLSHESVADESPAVSPDGKQIAFVRHHDGYDQLYVMAPGGRDKRRIARRRPRRRARASPEPGRPPRLRSRSGRQAVRRLRSRHFSRWATSVTRPSATTWSTWPAGGHGSSTAAATAGSANLGSRPAGSLPRRRSCAPATLSPRQMWSCRAWPPVPRSRACRVPLSVGRRAACVSSTNEARPRSGTSRPWTRSAATAGRWRGSRSVPRPGRRTDDGSRSSASSARAGAFTSSD